MSNVSPPEITAAESAEHYDVVVVGAGISGIAAAYHMQDQLPERSFVVLEAQDGFGGTWRTHTYPGVRSDSDLYTFGYRFKPWTGAPIATADKILNYMGEVIDDFDLDRHIRYNHAITTAVWSSTDKCWTLTATKPSSSDPSATETTVFTANFLWMCQGYYRHSEGYKPEWPGTDAFAGEIVHPQEWPDDLDYKDKKVVVIGSGATAATLIPAMAGEAAHVTMLQRTPTYFSTGRNANELADTLRELDVDETWIHEIVRRKVTLDGANVADASMGSPEEVKAELFAGIREIMGEDYDVDEHFHPDYRPWSQRIAFVPDGDLFHALKRGEASVVTDDIETFTANGIQLASGESLDADIIVSATGFNLNVLGDIAFTIDGEPLAFHDAVSYRGAMFTGIPNMAWVFGYFRASWTLRADLIADFICRIFAHMDEIGATVVVPEIAPQDADMAILPWVEPENFNPGYMQRGLHLLPKQGDRDPWRHTQDYLLDRDVLPTVDISDGTLKYS